LIGQYPENPVPSPAVATAPSVARCQPVVFSAAAPAATPAAIRMTFSAFPTFLSISFLHAHVTVTVRTHDGNARAREVMVWNNGLPWQVRRLQKSIDYEEIISLAQ
jgi:hypothetical protein